MFATFTNITTNYPCIPTQHSLIQTRGWLHISIYVSIARPVLPRIELDVITFENLMSNKKYFEYYLHYICVNNIFCNIPKPKYSARNHGNDT